eukprot:1140062-Pelagomonas_calceolata.AAC.2
MIPRANELGWFVLYPNFSFKLMLGIVCHGRITPKVSALWTKEAAGNLTLVARYDEVGPIRAQVNSDELVPGLRATLLVFWAGSVVGVFVMRMHRPLVRGTVSGPAGLRDMLLKCFTGLVRRFKVTLRCLFEGSSRLSVRTRAIRL